MIKLRSLFGFIWIYHRLFGFMPRLFGFKMLLLGAIWIYERRPAVARECLPVRAPEPDDRL